MKVLVTGGRDYADQRRVFQVLDEINPDFVIQGGARGADMHARAWAKDKGKPCATFDAQWERLGKLAGGLRNGWMLEYGQPDIVVAFPGGRGTENMKSQARDAGIEVREA